MSEWRLLFFRLVADGQVRSRKESSKRGDECKTGLLQADFNSQTFSTVSIYRK